MTSRLNKLFCTYVKVSSTCDDTTMQGTTFPLSRMINFSQLYTWYICWDIILWVFLYRVMIFILWIFNNQNIWYNDWDGMCYYAAWFIIDFLYHYIIVRKSDVSLEHTQWVFMGLYSWAFLVFCFYMAIYYEFAK